MYIIHRTVEKLDDEWWTNSSIASVGDKEEGMFYQFAVLSVFDPIGDYLFLFGRMSSVCVFNETCNIKGALTNKECSKSPMIIFGDIIVENGMNLAQ